MATSRDIPMSKRLRYLLEFVVVWGLANLLKILPVDASSAVGGAICRTIGPRLGVSRRAARNIKRAMPDKTPAEIKSIVLGMWNNLGRNAAEALHLGNPDLFDKDNRFEITGGEILDKMRDDGRGGIIFTAHIGNWETIGPLLFQRDMPLTTVYREANNPYVGAYLTKLRRDTNGARLVPKGASGARGLITALKSQHHLGLLVDQKLNDGIAIPFFGIDAMTAPALAQLALRFDVPMVPVHCERIAGTRFRMIIEPPLELAGNDDKNANIEETMRRVNAHMEQWIRAHPEQWLWLHNRWPNE